ncbi:uncharacterized protein H6S33_007681 [Morchella sextelata]|uniref:uncharacterized protein n=1 Tax=Morchella sextelata TaxID=1174677 RepID=UPI001D0536BC|nr:uncharacterized protein H6S33_007681 [Morchella sextelata]KAH0603359.1 hypothetical protein H6S33_007681 [Morchella sextelata]
MLQPPKTTLEPRTSNVPNNHPPKKLIYIPSSSLKMLGNHVIILVISIIIVLIILLIWGSMIGLGACAALAIMRKRNNDDPEIQACPPVTIIVDPPAIKA